MSDLFHEDIPFSFMLKIFDVMGKTPRHVFQILTKRHEILAELSGSLTWHSNIWMGVSVENQHWADRRIPKLLDIPAAVKFLSVEPLLKPVEISSYLPGIDWVIVGGESGHRARPMQVEWARKVRDDCVSAGVPFFFKQWGGRTSKSGGRVLDGRVWDEMPSP